MPVIDLAALRSLVESDLTDDALTIELAAAEADVERVAGPLGELREVHRSVGRAIILNRYAASVRAVREFDADDDLEAEDWRLDADGRTLWRLDTGPSPASLWGGGNRDGWVRVYYQARDDLAMRQGAVIALVKGGIAGTPGVLGLTEGNFSIQFQNGATWSSVRSDVTAGVEKPWNFA